MDLTGKTALVTGGAHRVGKALALGLARAGADVLVHYHSSDDDARATAAEIETLGRRVAIVRADLEDSASPEKVIDAARREFGQLDVLVNSASLFERAPLAEIDASAWDRVMAVNLRAPFLLSQAARPLLAAKGGVIVNIADLSAFQPWPSYAHHAVSKAGLVHLTRVLARAMAPEIRVNAIAPGTVLPPEDFDGRDNAGGADRRVLKMEGTPEAVVDALLYLVRADFVTGEVLTVDGGRMLL